MLVVSNFCVEVIKDQVVVYFRQCINFFLYSIIELFIYFVFVAIAIVSKVTDISLSEMHSEDEMHMVHLFSITIATPCLLILYFLDDLMMMEFSNSNVSGVTC